MAAARLKAAGVLPRIMSVAELTATQVLPEQVMFYERAVCALFAR